MVENRTQLQAQWEDVQGRVKKAWGALTDDEILQSEGDWDQLVAKIRSKTGESLQAVEGKLNEILDVARQSGEADDESKQG